MCWITSSVHIAFIFEHVHNQHFRIFLQQVQCSHDSQPNSDLNSKTRSYTSNATASNHISVESQAIPQSQAATVNYSMFPLNLAPSSVMQPCSRHMKSSLQETGSFPCLQMLPHENMRGLIAVSINHVTSPVPRLSNEEPLGSHFTQSPWSEVVCMCVVRGWVRVLSGWLVLSSLPCTFTIYAAPDGRRT